MPVKPDDRREIKIIHVLHIDISMKDTLRIISKLPLERSVDFIGKVNGQEMNFKLHAQENYDGIEPY